MNYLAGWYSLRTGRKNNSIALVSGGKHLQSDTYSSIGLVIGLILLYITKIAWLDSAIALVFGSIIIFTGYKILRETTSSLMDEADFKLISELGAILEQNRSDDWIDIHNLKLVKYGSSYHITCDLVLPWFMNIAQSHAEGKKLENLISEKFSTEVVFSLHTDECKKIFCQNCKNGVCKDRNQQFNSIIPFTTEHLTRELKMIK
jgi:cation diffusion facilitator family transporter